MLTNTMLLLGDILRKQAHPQLFGRKTALIWGDETWTYAALNSEVNRLANGLTALGVAKGDRVAVLGRNCVEYVVSYFALAKLGAIMVPINFWYRAGEVRYTLDQSGSTWLLVGTQFSAVAAAAAGMLEETALRAVVRWGEAAAPDEWIGSAQTRQVSYSDLLAEAADSEPGVDLAPDDPHIILYTSGTTGFPKGALFSHRAHYLHAMAWVIRTRTVEEDIGQLVYPLFHTRRSRLRTPAPFPRGGDGAPTRRRRSRGDAAHRRAVAGDQPLLRADCLAARARPNAAWRLRRWQRPPMSRLVRYVHAGPLG